MKEKFYHYTECGLDNIYIDGITLEKDDAGETIITIPYINKLRKLIEEYVIGRQGGLNGAELRYLRTAMELWQEELAEILQKDKQTIGRWERGETPIDGAAEIVIRRLAIEKLGLNLDLSTEELARRCKAAAGPQLICLRFANDNYSLISADDAA